MAQQTLVDQGHYIVEASPSHSETPHSLRLLWTRNRPVAEISTCKDTTFKRERDFLVPGGIRTRSPKKQAAADTSFRQPVHRDLLTENISRE
jgi:hypothetical protein